MLPQCLLLSFNSIKLTIQEQLTTENIQDGQRGGHHGYRNKIILAILIFHVAIMPPINFWLNMTYHSGADLD